MMLKLQILLGSFYRIDFLYPLPLCLAVIRKDICMKQWDLSLLMCNYHLQK